MTILNPCRWALSLLVSFAWLSPACAHPSPAAGLAKTPAVHPNRLDYVVLASLADGNSLLAFSAHRAPPANGKTGDAVQK
jgi:hypothetical protein